MPYSENEGISYKAVRNGLTSYDIKDRYPDYGIMPVESDEQCWDIVPQDLEVTNGRASKRNKIVHVPGAGLFGWAKIKV